MARKLKEVPTTTGKASVLATIKKAVAEERVAAVSSGARYDPALCEAVVKFSGDTGMSLTAFAGHIGCSREKLIIWAKAHPEFQEALDRANAARVLWLEGRAQLEQLPAHINFRLKALQRCAADDWAEKTTVVHEGGEKPLQLDVKMTPAEAYAQMVRETGGA